MTFTSQEFTVIEDFLRFGINANSYSQIIDYTDNQAISALLGSGTPQTDIVSTGSGLTINGIAINRSSATQQFTSNGLPYNIINNGDQTLVQVGAPGAISKQFGLTFSGNNIISLDVINGAGTQFQSITPTTSVSAIQEITASPFNAIVNPTISPSPPPPVSSTTTPRVDTSEPTPEPSPPPASSTPIESSTTPRASSSTPRVSSTTPTASSTTRRITSTTPRASSTTRRITSTTDRALTFTTALSTITTTITPLITSMIPDPTTPRIDGPSEDPNDPLEEESSTAGIAIGVIFAATALYFGGRYLYRRLQGGNEVLINRNDVQDGGQNGGRNIGIMYDNPAFIGGRDNQQDSYVEPVGFNPNYTPGNDDIRYETVQGDEQYRRFLDIRRPGQPGLGDGHYVYAEPDPRQPPGGGTLRRDTDDHNIFDSVYDQQGVDTLRRSTDGRNIFDSVYDPQDESVVDEDGTNAQPNALGSKRTTGKNYTPRADTYRNAAAVLEETYARPHQSGRVSADDDNAYAQPSDAYADVLVGPSSRRHKPEDQPSPDPREKVTYSTVVTSKPKGRE